MNFFATAGFWVLLAAIVLAVLVVQARQKNARAKKTWQDVWAAFAAKYPERKILKNWRMVPQKDAEGRTVFCVVWDSGTRPPERTWWMKKAPEAAAEEISAQEAGRLIQVGERR
jgi:hypothetical protein